MDLGGKIEKTTSNISNKPPSNPPVQTDFENDPDLDLLDQMIAENNNAVNSRVNFQYLGNALFTTNANVQILLNGLWYTPPGNEFYIDDIPNGNQPYRVSGTLTVSAGILGSYTVNVDNSGYINVGQHSMFYLIVDYNYLTEQFSVRISPTNY